MGDRFKFAAVLAALCVAGCGDDGGGGSGIECDMGMCTPADGSSITMDTGAEWDLVEPDVGLTWNAYNSGRLAVFAYDGKLMALLGEKNRGVAA